MRVRALACLACAGLHRLQLQNQKIWPSREPTDDVLSQHTGSVGPMATRVSATPSNERRNDAIRVCK